MKVNITFTEDPFLLPKYVQQVKAIPQTSIHVYYDLPPDQNVLYERGKNAQIIITDIRTTYDKELLSKWDTIKAIVTTSVGVDHIDTAYCKQRGIAVVNFPGFNARAVAEMAFANLISIVRKVPQASMHSLRGGWEYNFFLGTELEGKTLGLIGLGNVGTQIAQIARGMNMNILGYAKHPSEQRAQELGIERFVSLEELLSASDFVVIAVPATPETTNMIHKKTLAFMKPSAYLINVARWQIVNALDLADAIYTKKIAGAALDVIDKEPFNSTLADLRIQEMLNSGKVLLTPHIASNTKETLDRLGTRLVSEVTRLTKEIRSSE